MIIGYGLEWFGMFIDWYVFVVGIFVFEDVVVEEEEFQVSLFLVSGEGIESVWDIYMVEVDF